ncbi:PAP2 superfamily protein [Botrytis cinerea]
MCPTPNGDGLELEKSNNHTQPPSISLTAPPTEIIDAGLKSLNHYKRKLPPWRYNMRQALLPLVRWETPYLAWMQDKMRCPALDTYFAVTANLGTHTFFMIVLPILFWCGHTSLGRGMVHILATGVFITGFIKDMFSLPRPLSPPLHRITMSGSAALEYGFPSTHSANAVSVAVYALFTLHSPECQLLPTTKLALEIVSYSYAFSIVLGRLYCGMHGFVDVIVGSIIGALISVVECVYGSAIDNYLYSSTWKAPVTIAIVIILLIRVHPEPADDCPCFDDSVAFAAVMIGVELGGWHYASVPATVPFDLNHMGWVIVILRVLIGVLVIFAWREVMKPTLLKVLPHIFRVFENTGLILPRKFFMPASEYNNIPSRLKVDNVMPSVSDLPSLISSIRHAGRGRAVSVGPQSAADAYETLAYREKRRRDSLTDVFEGMTPRQTATKEAKDYFSSRQPTMDGAISSGMSSIHGGMNLPTPAQSRVGSYEQMMGAGHVMYTPGVSTPGLEGNDAAEDEITVGQENELDETEMFSRLEKPRVRYDVEVVTKLVVYSGIAWLAVEGNPIIFEVIGLGMGV